MRKFFKDLPKKKQDQLYDLYLPLFQKISDITYKELYEDIKNDLPFPLSETSIRSNLMARFRYSQKAINEVDELSTYQHKLEFEAHKLRRDRLVLNKTKRDSFDFEMLEERFANSIKPLSVSKFKKPKITTKTKNNVIKVYLADLHIGKYTKEEHREILNEVFNNIYFESKRYNRSHIEVYIVGDTVDGLLRLSQLQLIKSGMVDQVHVANELLTEFITNLHSNFGSVKLRFIDNDNHGEIRPLGSGRNEFPNENLSRFISAFLDQVCNKFNIDYEYGDELDSGEYKVLHGHQFRSHKAVMKFYDKSIIGHWHNYQNIDDKHITLPALVSGDSYTKSLGIVDSPPAFVIEIDGAFKKIDLDNEEK